MSFVDAIDFFEGQVIVEPDLNRQRFQRIILRDRSAVLIRSGDVVGILPL